MVKKRIKNIMSNEGMTLIEILLSIVILTIVVLSFSAMFIQSARTNQQSESIMDATYIAQTCMEEIITLYSNDSKTSCFGFVSENGEEWAGNKENYHMEIMIKSRVEGGRQVIVKVFKAADDMKPEAQMETVIR